MKLALANPYRLSKSVNDMRRPLPGLAGQPATGVWNTYDSPLAGSCPSGFRVAAQSDSLFSDEYPGTPLCFPLSSGAHTPPDGPRVTMPPGQNPPDGYYQVFSTGGYWGNNTPPAYYSAGLAVAREAGYSVPINSILCGLTSCVQVVNPDATVTTVFNWSAYPPTVGGNTVDASFVPPPQSVWNQYLLDLGVQTMAQQQAAATAAAIAAAQQSCAQTGGSWNAISNSCTAASGASGTLAAQQACLAQGKGWNPSTGACAVTAPTNGPGSLVFSTPHGSNPQVGDSWTVTITGATPNADVTVYGIHPDGSTAQSSMGQTLPDGTFTLSGTFDTTVEGKWTETWYVNGQQIGSPFSFTVGVPSSGTGTGGGGTPGGGSTGGGNTGGGGNGGPSVPSTIFGINSTYVLAGGAGLLLLLVMMGGKR